VTSAKVKDGTLLARDFRKGQLAVGARGPAGAQGQAGAQGVAGPTGAAGPAGSIQGAPAGGDLTGTFPDPSVANGAIGPAKLADGAVGRAKLAVGSVATAQLANKAVGPDQLGDGAVGKPQLGTAAVTLDKLKIVTGAALFTAPVINAGECKDVNTNVGGLSASDFPFIADFGNNSVAMAITTPRINSSGVLEVRLCNLYSSQLAFTTQAVTYLVIQH
jgi:hypothetical protein